MEFCNQYIFFLEQKMTVLKQYMSYEEKYLKKKQVKKKRERTYVQGLAFDDKAHRI